MEMLERLKRRAPAWPELKLAVLFGSRSWGDARPGSDADLGDLLDPYSAELRFQVEAGLGRAAECIGLAAHWVSDAGWNVPEGTSATTVPRQRPLGVY